MEKIKEAWNGSLPIPTKLLLGFLVVMIGGGTFGISGFVTDDNKETHQKLELRIRENEKSVIECRMEMIYVKEKLDIIDDKLDRLLN